MPTVEALVVGGAVAERLLWEVGLLLELLSGRVSAKGTVDLEVGELVFEVDLGLGLRVVALV